MHRVAAVVCVLWVFFVSGGLTWHYLRPLHQTSASNEETSDVALVNVSSSADPIEQFNERTADDEEILPLSIDGYRDWHRVNEKPFVASPKMTVLCRVTPSMLEDCAEDPQFDLADDAQLVTGTSLRQDGWTATLIVYVNELGKQAMLQKESPDFPVGSIIVKEKWKSLDDDAPQLKTVMRKRDAGYNPDCGDWEFAGFESDGALVEQGRLVNCMRCHTERPNTDYVFRSYLFGDDLWITRQ